MANTTPDVPEADNKTKEQEALQASGLADFRPLTTADVPGIAKYIKETSTPKRSAAPKRKASTSKKGGAKS